MKRGGWGRKWLTLLWWWTEEHALAGVTGLEKAETIEQ
jgi:hypothetical protein